MYDLLVIGGGSAGITAARFAAQLGVGVALVEKHRLGGDCTWTGCVPSKALLKAAKTAQQMRAAGRLGINSVEPGVDLSRVMARVRSISAEVYQQESPEALQAEGVEVLLGTARFVDPHTLAFGGTNLTARHLLLATGAHPAIPPIAGLDSTDYLTYEDIWDLEVLPKHLLVVGAGPVGCELAQAFRRLGPRVTLLVSGERLLPRDEPKASRVLADVFTGEGIDLRYNARAERAWQDTSGIHLVAGGNELAGDALLVAAGRHPNVEGLDLDKAGVAYSAKGIAVDDKLRTNRRHIYAAGDCIGAYQFTHYASWQAFMAVRNALLPGSSRGIPDRVPWTTFTDPEVAHVGLTEEHARQRFGDTVVTYEWPMVRVDRAMAEGQTAGFVKLAYRRKGALLGATIVAGRAGEMIHEWALALDRGLKAGDLARTIHVYPTYSTANAQAALAVRLAQVLGGTSGRVVRGLARLRR